MIRQGERAERRGMSVSRASPRETKKGGEGEKGLDEGESMSKR